MYINKTWTKQMQKVHLITARKNNSHLLKNKTLVIFFKTNRNLRTKKFICFVNCFMTIKND